MTLAKWKKIREVFERVLERAPDERAAFLDTACDTEVRVEVEALLEAHERPGDFLAAPAGDVREVPSLLGGPANRSVEEDLPCGAVLDGKYRIDALVGRGGMGSVYRATQLNLRRTVAIKLMRGAFLADRIACVRFEREALAIARLKHPNIVTIHDLGVAVGLGGYIVMEYVEGHSLRQELQRRAPLGVVEALGLTGQVCAAVAAAHRAGVVHRDLKPENIFLEAREGEPSVKVLDFGLAKFGEAFVPTGEARSESGDVPGDGTLSGTVLGTPAYMSPEQCRGEEADARSDVYALGCVLYEMLTGKPPFGGGRVWALVYRHIHEEPQRPGELVPELSAAIDEALLRALAKAPDERHPTVEAFGRELGVLGAASGPEAVTTGDPAAAGVATPPPVHATNAYAEPPNNIPQPVTRFVGRERQIVEVREWLERARLLTLVGPGGIGKTRLALEVARDALEAYPDGVWLVELDSVADPSLVVPTVAVALGVREEAGHATADRLRTWVRDKRLLLVLDNCEHLLEACALLTRSLLEGSAGLRVLATSREPLGIRGEAIWRVPALELPGAEADTREALASEAVRLFAHRATLSRPEFEVGDATAPTVAALCRRLDGIPLAIELAAARVRVLSVDEIDARLDDRFRLLTSGERTAPSRQLTLRATLDWSYDLLTGEEGALLRRLGAFSGGWTLEEAETVCSGGRVEEAALLDLLARLVDKSLLVVSVLERGTRYTMLETVRAYALERLREAGEYDETARRHSAEFLALVEKAEPRLQSPEAATWLERLEAEHDNIRAALGWLLENEPEHCLRLATAVHNFWFFHPRFAEGRQWIDAALERNRNAPVELRARALLAGGLLARQQGDLAAARVYYEASLKTAREANDAVTVAWACLNLGNLALMQGELPVARAAGEESLSLARGAGHDLGIAGSLNFLGEIARVEGDWAVARELYGQALAILRRIGHRPGVSTTLCNLAAVTSEEGDLGEARTRYGEALAIAHELGNRDDVALSLDGLGVVAAQRGAWERAARLAGAADAMRDAVGSVLERADRAMRERALARVRGRLGESRFEAVLAEGHVMPLEQALELADEPD